MSDTHALVEEARAEFAAVVQRATQALMGGRLVVELREVQQTLGDQPG